MPDDTDSTDGGGQDDPRRETGYTDLADDSSTSTGSDLEDSGGGQDDPRRTNPGYTDIGNDDRDRDRDDDDDDDDDDRDPSPPSSGGQDDPRRTDPDYTDIPDDTSSPSDSTSDQGSQDDPRRTDPSYTDVPDDGSSTATDDDMEDGSFNPRAEDSAMGSGVTGSEFAELERRAREEDRRIEDLQDRPAVASQFEQRTGVDPRQLSEEYDGAAVAYDPDEGALLVEQQAQGRQGDDVQPYEPGENGPDGAGGRRGEDVRRAQARAAAAAATPGQQFIERESPGPTPWEPGAPGGRSPGVSGQDTLFYDVGEETLLPVPGDEGSPVDSYVVEATYGAETGPEQDDRGMRNAVDDETTPWIDESTGEVGPAPMDSEPGSPSQAVGEETWFDERVDEFENATGVDIPGEGDVVQDAERFLSREARAHREGRGWIPSGAEASGYVRESQEFAGSGPSPSAGTYSGQEVTVQEANVQAFEGFGRRAGSTLNPAGLALGAGRAVEGTGEFAFNVGVSGALDPVDDVAGEGEIPTTGQSVEEAQETTYERAWTQVEEASKDVDTLATESEQSTRERPFSTIGSGAFEVGAIGASFATGAGIERAATAARSARVARRANSVVDYEDVTSPRGASGELPEFDTPASAPTEAAVREVRERAADQPASMEGVADGGARLYRSEDQPLGADVDVERGQYELPGLFTSPDLSPLRLREGADTSLSIRPRLPRVRGKGDQVTAFPGERIQGMPRSAQGARRIDDPDGGLQPDPDTAGARFLDEEAEPGTAYVRPTGSRTSELEAVFPPRSQFRQADEFAVRMDSGRVVPGRAYRRAGDDVDADMDAAAGGFDDAGRVYDADELPETRLSRRRDDGTPVGPPATTGASTASRAPSSAAYAMGYGSSAVSDGETGPTGYETTPTGRSTGPTGFETGTGTGWGSTGTPTGFTGWDTGTPGDVWTDVPYDGPGTPTTPPYDPPSTPPYNPPPSNPPAPPRDIDLPERRKDDEDNPWAGDYPQRFENPVSTPLDFLL